MNVILVLIDSLNKWMLEPYGGMAGVAPNMHRFARRAVLFDSHFIGSMPCMPARREIYSGRKDFLWRPWGHLEPFDTPLPQVAAAHGYKTMLVTDHYHYWEQSAHGYMQSFRGAELVRGHELDYWKTDLPTTLPDWVKAIEVYRPGQATRYYANVKGFRDERDFFPAKTFSAAVDWLDSNFTGGDFYLQVESFDVHEPFHVPEPYRSMWTKELHDGFNCWPPYQDERQRELFFQHATDRELDFIRGQYTGKLTMVDKWLGRLLDKLDQLNAWKTTAVIVTSDHGHDLGQRQAFGKQFPHYDSHANIPLMVWHPAHADRAGQRIDALTSTVDLNATLIEMLGVTNHRTPHSRSILPLIDGRASKTREHLLYGTYGTGACLNTGRHLLIQGFDPGRPLFLYSTRLPQLPLGPPEPGNFIEDAPVPVWKIPQPSAGKHPHPSLLFDRGNDPKLERNLIDEDPKLRADMQERLRLAMKEEGSPPEQFVRLGLN